MADFDGIVSAIKINAGRTDSTATTNATTAANKAQRFIEGSGNWYWMQEVRETVLVSTEGRVALPSDWKELREPFQWYDQALTDKHRHFLREIGEGEANARYDTTSSGDPLFWRIWKGQIYIYPPLRSRNLTLRQSYWAWSAAILGAGTNELSTRWESLWGARGTVEYLRMLREFKASDVWAGDARSPKPGTYLYELAMLKRVNTSRVLPRTLKPRGDSGQGPATPLDTLGYPFWSH